VPISAGAYLPEINNFFDLQNWTRKTLAETWHITAQIDEPEAVPAR
jgi:hypothetical protein